MESNEKVGRELSSAIDKLVGVMMLIDCVDDIGDRGVVIEDFFNKYIYKPLRENYKEVATAEDFLNAMMCLSRIEGEISSMAVYGMNDSDYDDLSRDIEDILDIAYDQAKYISES